ncbi:hypothetical protein B0J17DRAFT_628904 [Rhizoctonia solani]|nr:hypothetical protein B0J17DRAFT_628904 [Rhizoctonia solani]
MLLKESLALLKNKWKKGHPTSSRSNSLTRPGTPLPLTPIPPTVPTSTHSNQAGEIPDETASTRTGSQDSKSRPYPVRGNTKVSWSGIKVLLGTLESSTEFFGPLNSAITGLRSFVDIFELILGQSESKGHKEYDELREKLERLLNDLAGHVTEPMGFMMTNSFKRLCSDIEAEAKALEEKRARNTGRRLTDAIEASDEIFESYRRIHGHLERLTLNANLDILKTVNELTMGCPLTPHQGGTACEVVARHVCQL